MRILVVGEGFLSTGFGTVVTGILKCLEKLPDVDLYWYAVNMEKIPESAKGLDAKTFCRCNLKTDPLGYNGIEEVASNIDPELVILVNDAMPCAIWGNRIRIGVERDDWCPIVGYVPVDGEIVDPGPFEKMSLYGVNLLSFTKYGSRMVMKAIGLADLSDMNLFTIPWCYPGLDTSIFNTENRSVARAYWNRDQNRELLTDSDFVVCMTNRNAPRKFLHESIMALGEFAQNKPDVKVIIRAARYDWGGDYFPALNRAGLRGVITVGSDNGVSDGIDPVELSMIYQASDVFLSASVTEGFGYCEYEAAACGCALVLPDNTVRPELWPEQVLMPCYRDLYAPSFCNTIGGLVSRQSMISSLDAVYGNRRIDELKTVSARLAANRAKEWTWGRLCMSLIKCGMEARYEWPVDTASRNS